MAFLRLLLSSVSVTAIAACSLVNPPTDNARVGPDGTTSATGSLTYASGDADEFVETFGAPDLYGYDVMTGVFTSRRVSVELGGPSSVSSQGETAAPSVGIHSLGGNTRVCVQSLGFAQPARCVAAQGTVDAREYALTCGDSYETDVCTASVRVCAAKIDMTVTIEATPDMPLSGTFRVQVSSTLLHSLERCTN